MTLKLVLRCYHCGDTNAIKTFCSDYSHLIVSNHPYDNKWAGIGMYLWDNNGNAKWWHNKRNDKDTRSICSCILQIGEDKLLDFTDISYVETMENFLDVMKSSGNLISDEEIGLKVDFLVDYFEAEVVKIMGDYSFKESNKFFPKFDGRAVPGTPARIIYCVKPGNSHVLIQRSIEEVV